MNGRGDIIAARPRTPAGLATLLWGVAGLLSAAGIRLALVGLPEPGDDFLPQWTAFLMDALAWLSGVLLAFAFRPACATAIGLLGALLRLLLITALGWGLGVVVIINVVLWTIGRTWLNPLRVALEPEAAQIAAAAAAFTTTILVLFLHRRAHAAARNA